jgi:hypothetical protein
MELKEFVAEQKQLIDDFCWTYQERRKKGKENTMFRPEPQWLELLQEYLDLHRTNHGEPIPERDEEESQQKAA